MSKIGFLDSKAHKLAFHNAGHLYWSLLVDWNNDGVWDVDEAPNRIQSVTIRRGRRSYLRSDGGGFSQLEIGEAVVTLRNNDQRYDPLNSSSPLYPNVLPGTEIYLKAGDGTTVWGQIRGKIYKIVTMGQGNAEKVRITIHDGVELLQQDIAYALQQNKRTDQAIGYCLDTASWPAAWGRSLETDPDTLDWWWVPAADPEADRAIQSLSDSALGTFFVAGDGKATYIQRQSWIGKASAFTLDASKYAREGLSFPSPYDAIYNKIQVTCHPRVQQATSVLWSLWDTPMIAPGQTITVTAEFSYNNNACPATSVITPAAATTYTATTISFSATQILDSANQFLVQGFAVGDDIDISGSAANSNDEHTITAVTAGAITCGTDSFTVEAAGPSVTVYRLNDYRANAASDNTGANLTANLTVTPTVAAETDSLALANTGATALYVTRLRVRGDPIDAPDAAPIVIDNSAGSRYGTRTFELDASWQQTLNVAVDLATYLSAALDSLISFPVVQVRNQLAIQLGNDLFAVFTLTNTEMGINSKYRIGFIEQEWSSEHSEVVNTTFTGEPVDETIYWLLGVSGYSELGVTTRLGY